MAAVESMFFSVGVETEKDHDDERPIYLISQPKIEDEHSGIRESCFSHSTEKLCCTYKN
jgi:hypothetical protein